MRRLAIALLALAACACASVDIPQAPDAFRSPSFQAPPPGSLIVLLPLMESTGELEPGNAIVRDQLHRQLVDAGYRVAVLNRANFGSIWAQEVTNVGGIYDNASGSLRTVAYATALGNVARHVCEETKCSMVLKYQLAPRTAEMRGASGTWDGQRRIVPIKGHEHMEFSGTTPALSVELIAMAADGTLAFRTFGGTSLPYQVDALLSKSEIRQDLFSTPDETTDGVRIALQHLVKGRAAK